MRRDAFDAADLSPAALRTAYFEFLADVLEREGLERAVAETDLDPALLEAIRAGEEPTTDLEAAAAIMALGEDAPAETLAAEARDILLMGMTTAVVDVESLASAIDDAMEPKEIQQKVEGRFPMTLAEFALLHHELASSTP